MAKKTFIVAHPKQFLKVDGKLAHVKKDSEIVMEEKHAASLVKQGKLLVKGAKPKVEVGSESADKDEK